MIGRMLRNRRADEAESVWHDPRLAAPETIEVRSTDFADEGLLPERAAQSAENLSPALSWEGVPERTAQLLLVIEDCDVPLPHPVVHTLALIPPSVAEVETGALAEVAVFLPASFGRTGYFGPRPPRGHGPHRYGFLLFALDREIEPGSKRDALLAAAEGRVLARGRITGIFERV